MEGLVGYTTNWWTQLSVACLTVLTGGLLWPVAYSFPQTMIWALKECSLCEAHYILVKVCQTLELRVSLAQPETLSYGAAHKQAASALPSTPGQLGIRTGVMLLLIDFTVNQVSRKQVRPAAHCIVMSYL